jgi:hypothetical protein
MNGSVPKQLQRIKKNSSNQPQKFHHPVTNIKFPRVGDLKVRGIIAENNGNMIKTNDDDDTDGQK